MRARILDEIPEARATVITRMIAECVSAIHVIPLLTHACIARSAGGAKRVRLLFELSIRTSRLPEL